MKKKKIEEGDIVRPKNSKRILVVDTTSSADYTNDMEYEKIGITIEKHSQEIEKQAQTLNKYQDKLEHYREEMMEYQKEVGKKGLENRRLKEKHSQEISELQKKLKKLKECRKACASYFAKANDTVVVSKCPLIERCVKYEKEIGELEEEKIEVIEEGIKGVGELLRENGKLKRKISKIFSDIENAFIVDFFTGYNILYVIKNEDYQKIKNEFK